MCYIDVWVFGQPHKNDDICLVRSWDTLITHAHMTRLIMSHNPLPIILNVTVSQITFVTVCAPPRMSLLQVREEVSLRLTIICLLLQLLQKLVRSYSCTQNMHTFIVTESALCWNRDKKRTTDNVSGLCDNVYSVTRDDCSCSECNNIAMRSDCMSMIYWWRRRILPVCRRFQSHKLR